MARESLGQDFGQGSVGVAFFALHGVAGAGPPTTASPTCLAAGAGDQPGIPKPYVGLSSSPPGPVCSLPYTNFHLRPFSGTQCKSLDLLHII